MSTLSDIIQSYTKGQMKKSDLIDKLIAFPYKTPARFAQKVGKDVYATEDWSFGEPDTWDEVRRANARGDIDNTTYLDIVKQLRSPEKEMKRRELRQQQIIGELLTKAWDEEAHTRDEHGRFGSGGFSAASVDTSNIDPANTTTPETIEKAQRSVMSKPEYAAYKESMYGWTGNNEGPKGSRFQLAAIRQGYGVASESDLEAHLLAKNYVNSFGPASEYLDAHPELQGAMEKQYALTQKLLGDGETVGYRGFHFTPEQLDALKNGQSIQYKEFGMQSWSGDQTVAKRFGNAVIKLSIPNSKIFASSATDRRLATRREKEIITLGGSQPMTITPDMVTVKSSKAQAKPSDLVVEPTLDFEQFLHGDVEQKWAELIRELKDWDEDSHPRDDHGRFGDGGGGDNTVGNGKPITSIDDALKSLKNGQGVMFERPEQAVTLLNKLADIGAEAKAKGEKAPMYDLCKVSITGTNLFCADNVNIPRSEMPQFKGTPTPGSPADELPKNDKGRVDAGEMFEKYLDSQGIKVENTDEDASRLRASQNQLDGVKVAEMMRAIDSGKLSAPARIFTSNDNYIIDGHHRWAAEVAIQLEHGGKVRLPIARIDQSVLNALKTANGFTQQIGINHQKAGETALHHLRQQQIINYLLSLKDWEEDAHPRDEHGRFGDGGGGSSMAESTLLGSGRQLDMEKILPPEKLQEFTSKYRDGYSAHEDMFLKNVQQQQGFDSKPQIVSSQEFQKIIDNGGTEVWRAEETPNFAEQLRNGAYFTGTGVFGNGTYSTIDRAEAESYKPSNGELLHIALRPEARTIDSSEALRKCASAADRYYDKANGASDDKLEEQYRTYGTLIDDAGRWAALNGYDAIIANGGQFVVFLNRSAMAIERDKNA